MISKSSRFRRSPKAFVFFILIISFLFSTGSAFAMTSDLWGVNGERWSPGSRLPDFSFAGYKKGEVGIPDVPQVKNVKTDFGARGDGSTDDTNAFKAAIAGTSNGALYIPPGTYNISKVLRVSKGNLVLRGAGEGQTILNFTKPINQDSAFPCEGRYGCTNATHGYWEHGGGMIWVEGRTNGSKISNVSGSANRGDNTLTLSNVSGVSVGSTIRLRMTDTADDSLTFELQKHTVDLEEASNWTGGKVVDWKVKVIGKSGNTITLERPLRVKILSKWKPEVWSYSPTIREFGIENLTIKFPAVPWAGHHKDPGYNGVMFWETDNSWIRNVEIINTDNGISLRHVVGGQIENIEFNRESGRGSKIYGSVLPNAAYGHNGISVSRQSQDVLVRNVDFNNYRFAHDIGVAILANGNVFSNVVGDQVNMDFHRAASYENLFTDINVGIGETVFHPGTNHSGYGSTFWNIRKTSGEFGTWPGPLDSIIPKPQMNAVGFNIPGNLWATNKPNPNDLNTTQPWIERWEGSQTQPANLHLAMFKKRTGQDYPSGSGTYTPPNPVPDPTPGPQPDPTPAPATSLGFSEAEDATITSPAVAARDGNASGGEYTLTPQGQGGKGDTTFSINIPAGGTYSVWARVLAPDGSSNSYNVSINGGAETDWHITNTDGSWHWAKVQDASFSAGTQTVKFKAREDGAQLDGMYVLSGSCEPSGLTGSNCDGSGGGSTPPPDGGGGSEKPTPPPVSGGGNQIGPSNDTSGSLPTGTAYYVDQRSGNDGNNGRSPNAPWKTLGKVNSTNIPAGADVYLKVGSLFRNESLNVDWDGTASNKVIIGAYHGSGSSARTGIGGNNRPIIEHSLTGGATYNGRILITGRHVILEDVEIRKSGGNGVNIIDTDNVTVRNVITNETYRDGLRVSNSDTILFENNEVIRNNLGFGELKTESNWGNGIKINKRSSNVTVRGNIVRQGYGEGIDTWDGSRDVVIEDNYVYDNRAISIYIDSTDGVIVRNNIVVGSADPTYWRGGNRIGSAIVSNNEKFQFQGYGGSVPISNILQDVEIYNNAVVGAQAGIAFWGQLPETVWENFNVYNNTIVDNNTNYTSTGKPYRNVDVRRNIFLSLSSASNEFGGSPNHGGITWADNYWSSNPGGRVDVPSNQYSGIRLAKMSGWRNVRSLTEITADDFRVVSGPTSWGADVSKLPCITNCASAPTPKPDPIPDPTPGPDLVPGSSTKFEIGDRVVTTDNLNTRVEPRTSALSLGTHSTGDTGTVNAGSVDANGYSWWFINYDNAPDGWSVENWLEETGGPTPAPTIGKFKVGDRVQTTISTLNTRSQPTVSSTNLGQHPQGDGGFVVGGPVPADGYIWWQIDYDNAPSGWSAENWLELAFTVPTPNPDPTPTLPPEIPDDPTPIPLPVPTPDPTPIPPVSQDSGFIEAEGGQVTAPAVVRSDSRASGGRYTTTPNGDGGKGDTTLSFNLGSSGVFTIWARVLAPNGQDNSYKVSRNGGSESDWHITNTSREWQWAPVVTTGMNAGSNTIKFKSREDGTSLDGIRVVSGSCVPTGLTGSNCTAATSGSGGVPPKSGGAPAGVGDLGFFEAEDARVTAPAVVRSDSRASGGQYTTTPNGDGGKGDTTFTVNFPEARSYTIWGRVLAPNGQDNSYKFSTDSRPESDWHITNTSRDWKWVRVSDERFTAGTHTIKFKSREDGTSLDGIFIGKDSTCTPSGLTGSNCIGGTEKSSGGSAAAPTLDFDVDRSGGSAVLTWTTTGAVICDTSGDWLGNKIPNGTSVRTNVSGAETYTLTCTGDGGSVTKSVTVTQ